MGTVVFITFGTAALGLLFYWVKRRKKSHQSYTVKEDVLADYGVQVMSSDNQLIDLTKRPVMVAEVINIPYGSNGSLTLHSPISGVSVDADYQLDPASDGKVMKATFSGNTIYWNWVNAKAILPTPAKLIVFTGG